MFCWKIHTLGVFFFVYPSLDGVPTGKNCPAESPKIGREIKVFSSVKAVSVVERNSSASVGTFLSENHYGLITVPSDSDSLLCLFFFLLGSLWLLSGLLLPHLWTGCVFLFLFYSRNGSQACSLLCSSRLFSPTWFLVCCLCLFV